MPSWIADQSRYTRIAEAEEQPDDFDVKCPRRSLRLREGISAFPPDEVERVHVDVCEGVIAHLELGKSQPCVRKGHEPKKVILGHDDRLVLIVLIFSEWYIGGSAWNAAMV